jgi:hypothetical protein
MGLWEETTTPSGSRGIFVNDVIIRRAKDVSGTEPEQYERGFVFDLEVEIEYEIVEKGWNRTSRIGGNYKRDEQSGEILSSGSAFKVERLFESAGILDALLDENNNLKEDTLNKLVGKSVALLKYPNNNGNYSDWDITARPGGWSYLKNQFIAAYKARGYPKNYDAEGESDDTSFDYGANVEEDAGGLL